MKQLLTLKPNRSHEVQLRGMTIRFEARESKELDSDIVALFPENDLALFVVQNAENKTTKARGKGSEE